VVRLKALQYKNKKTGETIMMVDIKQYKPHSNVTKEMLRDNNFKYIDGDYSYRFPVIKYKKNPIIWCNILVNMEQNWCGFNVTDSNFNTYPAYFNRKYGGVNKVVETIDKKIKRQLDIFVKNNILKKKKQKEGVK
jgi:hypothetical protein